VGNDCDDDGDDDWDDVDDDAMMHLNHYKYYNSSPSIVHLYYHTS